MVCGTRDCKTAQLFPSIVNNASREMSQHLVGVFLEAFTFAKTTQRKNLKLIRTVIRSEVLILIVFSKWKSRTRFQFSHFL